MRMDPNDELRAHLAGHLCPACNEPIGADGINILTKRSGVIFVHLLCSSCGTITLGLVAIEKADPGERPDLISYEAGPEGLQPRPEIVRTRIVGRDSEMTPADFERLADSGPIDTDDVLAMHQLLAGWQGDLVGLLGGEPGSSGGESKGAPGEGGESTWAPEEGFESKPDDGGAVE